MRRAMGVGAVAHDLTKLIDGVCGREQISLMRHVAIQVNKRSLRCPQHSIQSLIQKQLTYDLRRRVDSKRDSSLCRADRTQNAHSAHRIPKKSDAVIRVRARVANSF